MKPKSVHYFWLKMADGRFHIFVKKEYTPIVIDEIAVKDNEDEAKKLADTYNQYKQNEKSKNI